MIKFLFLSFAVVAVAIANAETRGDTEQQKNDAVVPVALLRNSRVNNNRNMNMNTINRALKPLTVNKNSTLSISSSSSSTSSLKVLSDDDCENVEGYKFENKKGKTCEKFVGTEDAT
eukprot:CAMPEP_0170877040 /NCGR_PEP_ID=MMETSP0734-20130129/30067_1 /TAXON_ID=186038 /ORGANISM="Fragilariopsis kerguelensis, Strain L26-C5" /LENGTH=116 /DNA_ID=CAMNT_0011259225 /DNA_START=60 /DNA_END=407 /DNA_ORIENTATION=+